MRFLLSYPHEIERRRRELGMSLQDVATISRISYTQLQDIERGRIQTLAAPVLDALAETLDCDASRFSADWFPPHAPRVTMVYVRAEMIREYLDKSGLNAHELARRADVPHRLSTASALGASVRVGRPMLRSWPVRWGWRLPSSPPPSLFIRLRELAYPDSE